MNTPSSKRSRGQSPDDADMRKHRAVSSSSTQEEAEKNAHSPLDSAPPDHFIVDVKLHSKAKAARNDPAHQDESQAIDWLDGMRAMLGLDFAKPKAPEKRAEDTDPDNPADVTKKSPATSTKSHFSGDAGPDENEPILADGKPMSEDHGLSGDAFSEHSSDDIRSDTSERSCMDVFAHFDWLEPLDGFVAYTGGSANIAEHHHIGYCQGYLIRRGCIRANFHDEMEEPCRETSLLSYEMFDRYGRLKMEYKNHPIRKGSGIWKEELDFGDILLIEEIRIDEDFRRRGLGTKLMKAMLEKAAAKTHGFIAMTWPTVLMTRQLRDEMEGKTHAEQRKILCPHEDIAVSFCRSQGFRRVGSSEWFGLASAPDHPCHSLAARDDYDPVEQRHDLSNYPQFFTDAMKEADEALGVQMLTQVMEHTPAADPSWLVLDEDGNTLLHLSALRLRPKVVKWLLGHEFSQNMLTTRNDAGDTPLEALLTDLEKQRTRKDWGTRTLPMSDKFEGHSTPAVICLAHLKALTLCPRIELARLRFGCTCGQCIKGFLSPRMTYALLCQAETNHNTTENDNDGAHWVGMNDHMLEFVPAPVVQNLLTNKGMRQGFINLFDHIATCLRAKRLPTQANVLAALDDAGEWPPSSKTFLQRGGSVASVVNECFRGAMAQDALAGDGYHAVMFASEIEKLPECRNDHEFGFVSGMCGYKRVSGIRNVDVFGEEIDLEEAFAGGGGGALLAGLLGL